MDGAIRAMDAAALGMARARAAMLAAIPGFEAAGAWRRDGATSMTAWLAARYRLGRGTAREWVRVARALRSLPRIAAAHAAGSLSWDQVQPLTRFADPSTDQEWARRGPAMRPKGLWREAKRHERVRRREEDARRQRYLAITRDPDLPLVWIEGALPAEEGAALEAAVERRAEQVAVEEGLPDPQGARRADALVELATGEGSRPAGATLVVHADAQVLTGAEPVEGPVLAETAAGDRLSADAVRRIACDARIEWVAEADGRPVGVGRRRGLPGWLARLLRHRDGGCRFPGCERRQWVHGHHLVHWADGGTTDLDNLALLCGAHHRLIHEGGWRITGHPARDLRFHDPEGRPLRPLAVPMLA